VAAKEHGGQELDELDSVLKKKKTGSQAFAKAVNDKKIHNLTIKQHAGLRLLHSEPLT
jgi:hypothetical protein